MAAVPFCRIYHYEEEGMSFKVTFTLRARKVEKWIRVIQEKFLHDAPIICVGLDVEYNDAVPNVKQRNHPLEQKAAHRHPPTLRRLQDASLPLLGKPLSMGPLFVEH
jgi:hypothetical protein